MAGRLFVLQRVVKVAKIELSWLVVATLELLLVSVSGQNKQATSRQQQQQISEHLGAAQSCVWPSIRPPPPAANLLAKSAVWPQSKATRYINNSDE